MRHIVGVLLSMKWTVKDVDMYQQAKEYIDTVFVPLVPITFGDQMKRLTASSDLITILSMEIEKKFKGRIFLTPVFYYVNGDKKKSVSLQIWLEELKQAEFKYIYFLSPDRSWESEEQNLIGSFLFIPDFSEEQLEVEQAQEVIKQQSQIIIDIFVDKWKNGNQQVVSKI